MIDKPVLLDVPERIVSDRLELRAVSSGVGRIVNEAIVESHAELARWMPWASPCPKPEESEEWCRRAHAKFVVRDELQYHGYLRDRPDTFVCSVGLFNIAWNVPRGEVGYWLRTRFAGQGFMTEAVRALCAMAFDALGMNRIELRCNDRNVRSVRVAELAGFALEGVLRQQAVAPDGTLRDSRVYALLRPQAAGRA
jgi:RimJ/RimL family protein N-acetyltransferase